MLKRKNSFALESTFGIAPKNNINFPQVYPHSGIVLAGNYSFPFQYQLPANIPGSFYEKGSSPFGHGSGYFITF
jgi:hypothetical protein